MSSPLESQGLDFERPTGPYVPDEPAPPVPFQFELEQLARKCTPLGIRKN